MKGLIVDIYKHEGQSFDNGRGISSHCDGATLIPSADFPMLDGQIFDVDSERPAVVIVKRNLFGHGEPYLTAYPADENGQPDKSGGAQFGGCYIVSSDSRFPARYPVPLHDRKEW